MAVEPSPCCPYTPGAIFAGIKNRSKVVQPGENGVSVVTIRSRTPLFRLVAYPVLSAQLVVAVSVTLTVLMWKGSVAGYSALIGGMIALLPNAYFAYKAFRYFGARSARAIVQSLWSGEMGKLFLTAALFALVFVGVKELNVAALFAGYGLVLGTSASALLLVKGFSRH